MLPLAALSMPLFAAGAAISRPDHPHGPMGKSLLPRQRDEVQANSHMFLLTCWDRPPESHMAVAYYPQLPLTQEEKDNPADVTYDNEIWFRCQDPNEEGCGDKWWEFPEFGSEGSFYWIDPTWFGTGKAGQFAGQFDYSHDGLVDGMNCYVDDKIDNWATIDGYACSTNVFCSKREGKRVTINSTPSTVTLQDAMYEDKKAIKDAKGVLSQLESKIFEDGTGCDETPIEVGNCKVSLECTNAAGLAQQDLYQALIAYASAEGGSTFESENTPTPGGDNSLCAIEPVPDSCDPEKCLEYVSYILPCHIMPSF